MFKNFPDFKQNDTIIAAFGKNTVKAAEEKGLKILKTFESAGFSFDEKTTKARMKKDGWNKGEANYIFFRE